MAIFNPGRPPSIFRNDPFALRWFNELETRVTDDIYTKTELNNGALNVIYYSEEELDAGQLDNRYYTEAELDAGKLDARYYTEAESDARFAAPLGVQTVNTTSNLVSNTVYLASGNITLTMPVVAEGAQVHIKKIDAGSTITVSGAIDGYTNITMNIQYQSYMLVSDGTQWYIV